MVLLNLLFFSYCFCFFFFNDTATTEIYTLSLHDALPIFTEYAQSELGDIVFVDIDPDLTEVKVGETLGTIEAVKTVSDLLAPCSGKVIEINTALADAPEDVNTDPYGKGWMIKIELSDPSEIEKMMDAEAYKNLIGQ